MEDSEIISKEIEDLKNKYCCLLLSFQKLKEEYDGALSNNKLLDERCNDLENRNNLLAASIEDKQLESLKNEIGEYPIFWGTMKGAAIASVAIVAGAEIVPAGAISGVALFFYETGNLIYSKWRKS